MKFNLVIAAAAVVTLAAAPAPSPTAVAYGLSPVIEGGDLTALRVTVKFRGDADGETVLQLPDRWASEKELWRYVRDLKIEGARSTAVGADPGKRVIRAGPGAPITVTYNVVTGYDADPEPTNGNPFKPIIRPQWFYAYGEALFAYPDDRQDADASFRWTGAPRGFGFASDLEHLAGARPGKVGDVNESIVVGGPGLRVYSQTVGGAPLRIAMLGTYVFADEDFTALAQRVVGVENAFWGGQAEPFLIALAPLKAKDGNLSLGGTGRTDAFAMTASTDAELQRFRYLLAHEHFHTWNSRDLGGMYDGDQEPAAYWFSEGFTDFYAWRLMLRAGILSLEDFAASWNEMLAAYGTSAARTEPNARIVKDFWTDYAVEKLPYQRGALLAAVWDHRLSQSSGGRVDLDDVLRAMRAETLRSRAAGTKPVLAPVQFATAYAAAGGADLAADLDRYVERGELVLLPADLFGDCARVETVTRAAFARGWDADATSAAGNVLTGLRDDSPAWRAGLRNGMKIVKREFGEPGNSTVEYGLRIKAADGAETVYRFMPVGTGPDETVQKIVLTPGMDEAKRAACARTMSGD